MASNEYRPYWCAREFARLDVARTPADIESLAGHRPMFDSGGSRSVNSARCIRPDAGSSRSVSSARCIRPDAGSSRSASSAKRDGSLLAKLRSHPWSRELQKKRQKDSGHSARIVGLVELEAGAHVQRDGLQEWGEEAEFLHRYLAWVQTNS
eukprot:1891454-Alexandrium_andersonii.AAC.1